MRLAVLLFFALLLVVVFAACGVGFLATFELPGWPVLRTVYAGVGIAALAGAFVLASVGIRGDGR